MKNKQYPTGWLLNCRALSKTISLYLLLEHPPKFAVGSSALKYPDYFCY